MKFSFARISGTLAVLFTYVLLSSNVQTQAQFAGNGVPAGSALTIPQAQLLMPDALQKLLTTTSAEKPLMLQVGSHMMFAEGHIPGSEYVGQGSQPAGLQQLQTRVNSLPRKKSIVLYCGCCPWNRCPNLGPAFAKLHELGFTNVKVLYLAYNFGADWASKGYPVEQGR
jgi:thiosulfate/3-mercaptopyruvate sulfurtransferase